ncbi:TPA: O-antigen ligase family protein [Citrobacter farmeri]|nr:O-antigen ligase family protein [Citrobacter farmeri]HEM7987004.1 O-antigen ligase family protein [Citrobacter farmeri]
MPGMLSKIYIFIILVIYPSLTLFSLFGLFPFYPINFVVLGLGLFILLGMVFSALCKVHVSISFNDYLIATAFLWFFVVILLHNNLHSYTEDGRYISALRYYTPFFITSLCCYFIFKKGCAFFIKPIGLYSLLLMYGALAVITILYFNPGTFKIDFSQLIDPSFIGVYQIVSDSLAFTVICILSLSKISKPFKIAIALITLFFLLILNARSGLIGFILALCFIFNIRKSFIENPSAIIFCLLLGIIIFIVIIPDFQFVFSFFENYNSRIYNIISGNFSDDASFLGRMKLLLHSLSIIVAHPVLGDFGSQGGIDIDGFGVRWGAYTHNVFVYWDQFGIIGFTLIGLIIFMSCYNNKQLKKTAGIDLFALIVLVLSQQIFLKSFTYFYLFAMAGLIEGVKYVSKHNYNHQKLK